ncbi:MAG: hypothetical protein RMY28_036185 [Nostoc sp. ChiSLP01]|nr:hypothetical protein [Nostoc sp. CmiSLP01]MDZ8282554.1 hypothetical protein [Nostoc sp. ChiSLP01]
MVCTLHKTQSRELREVYEAFLGDRICDTTWRTVRQFISESGLELDSNNLHEYAQLRKRYPKLSLTPLEFRAILGAFDNFKKLLPKLITGDEFINLLISQNITPDISTIYRWFKQAGTKYNKSSCYSTEVMFSVIYRAVVWKFVDTRRKKNV